MAPKLKVYKFNDPIEPTGGDTYKNQFCNTGIK